MNFIDDKLKMKQIQDGLKTDLEIYFIDGVSCKMKQIQDSVKADPAMNFIDVQA